MSLCNFISEETLTRPTTSIRTTNGLIASASINKNVFSEAIQMNLTKLASESMEFECQPTIKMSGNELSCPCVDLTQVIRSQEGGAKTGTPVLAFQTPSSGDRSSMYIITETVTSTTSDCHCKTCRKHNSECYTHDSLNEASKHLQKSTSSSLVSAEIFETENRMIHCKIINKNKFGEVKKVCNKEEAMSNTLNMMPSVLDSTAELMKYRVNYPNLLEFVRQNLIKGNFYNVSYQMGLVSDTFADKVHTKRALKDGGIETHSITTESSLNDTFILNAIKDGMWNIKHQWKCRYYALLDAVDLMYKDYRLLHHICNENQSSTSKDIPDQLLAYYSDMLDFGNEKNTQSYVLAGSDPASFLAYQLSLHLHCIDSLNFNSNLSPVRNHTATSNAVWPRRFSASVAFIADVIAQCRLVRIELEKRINFHERALYVMQQAKEQREKLKQSICEQKEKLTQLIAVVNGLKQKFLYPITRTDLQETVRKGKMSESQQKVDSETQRIEREQKKNDELHQCLLAKSTSLTALERVLREEESRRKKLHNRLQEITGNIRVYCRIRPSSIIGLDTPVSYLKVASDDKLLVCPDDLPDRYYTRNGHLLKPTRLSPNTEGIKCFIFDKVFGPEAKQMTVYKEVDDLVMSCVDGYNVCIMAYGQTGSGKTHTMVGTQEQPGVNRRAIQRLLRLCNDRRRWEYQLSMSMLEVYQEEVFDLLVAPEAESTSGDIFSHRQTSNIASINIRNRQEFLPTGRKLSPTGFMTAFGVNSFAQPRPTLQRRKSLVRLLSTQDDELVLQNLTEREIMTEKDVLDCLELGERRRSVGSTQLNTVSSRSHLILLLRVTGEHRIHKNLSRGTLILADLAGSENVTKSGSVGQRFQEAACINKSLCCLGRVFDSLRRHKKPAYRETKLTYLLKPTLGGDSKCLLFINVRGEPENVDETLRAINFGQGALQVAPWKAAASGGCHQSFNRTSDNILLKHIAPANLQVKENNKNGDIGSFRTNWRKALFH